VNLYFTRHGQPVVLQPTEDPDYPVGNPYLSEVGREQARLLGERLKEEAAIQRIYASPYLRTLDTAAIIATVLDVPLYPDARYREMTTSSTFQLYGHSLEELRSRYPQIAVDATLGHPWWTTEEEPLDASNRRPDILSRVTHLLEEIRAREIGDILLVGHGATVGATYHYLQDRLPAAQLNQPEIYNWNCSLFGARVGHQVEFSHLDDTCHLPPELTTSNSRRREEVLVAA